jgi:hypothetical protein
MIHNWVLFELAFPFQYIGLIILLPHLTQRALVLWLAFFLGLLVDVFSNTPGIHSGATVFIGFARLRWLQVVDDTAPEELDLTLSSLGWVRFALYIFPLIFVHHAIVFILENEGLSWFLHLLAKIFWSSIFSFAIIWLVAMYIAPKKRRI